MIHLIAQAQKGEALYYWEKEKSTFHSYFKPNDMLPEIWRDLASIPEKL
ncbi:MAG: hypothetical protein Ct9H300mP28_03760 [Pseudomonadota bacterium]|nr:MAG: hypothetical protein Ct9H300mP28_03760 [Pseudomonadota bacterium]